MWKQITVLSGAKESSIGSPFRYPECCLGFAYATQIANFTVQPHWSVDQHQNYENHCEPNNKTMFLQYEVLIEFKMNSIF